MAEDEMKTICSRADIIGLTSTGAAKYRSFFYLASAAWPPTAAKYVH